MDLLGGGLSKAEKREMEEKFANLQAQIDELKLLNKEPTLIEEKTETKEPLSPNTTDKFKILDQVAGKSVTFVNASAQRVDEKSKETHYSQKVSNVNQE